MIWSWIGITCSGILGGIAKAMRDVIAFNWDRSIFRHIKNERWRRWFESNTIRPKHLIWFLWDGWHFSDTLSYIALLTAMLFVPAWYQMIVCALVFGAAFQLFFHVVFVE